MLGLENEHCKLRAMCTQYYSTQKKIIMTIKRIEQEKERKREMEGCEGHIGEYGHTDYNGMVFDKLFAPFVRQ